MTREELRDVIRDTVDETLTRLGLETDDPREMQLDFAHLRSTRLTLEQAQKRGMLVLVGVFVTALITLIYLGFRDWLDKGGR